MANEKQQIKQQLEQQEQLASSLERATIRMDSAGSSAINLTGKPMAGRSERIGSFPFGLPEAKGKLILPTALWVLLILAGVCFLLLLASLSKSMRTLNTLVELELNEANQRESDHLFELERREKQRLSELKQSYNHDRIIYDHGPNLRPSHSHERGAVGTQDSSWWPSSSSDHSSWFPTFGRQPSDSKLQDKQQSSFATKETNGRQEPRVISSTIEYVIGPQSNSGLNSIANPTNNDAELLSPLVDSMIGNMLDWPNLGELSSIGLGRDLFEPPRQQAAKKSPTAGQRASSDLPGAQITANIDKIDVRINTGDDDDEDDDEPKETKQSINMSKDIRDFENGSKNKQRNQEQRQRDQQRRKNNLKNDKSEKHREHQQTSHKILYDDPIMSMSMVGEEPGENLNNLLSLLFPVGVPIKQNDDNNPSTNAQAQPLKGHQHNKQASLVNNRPFVKLTNDDNLLGSILDLIESDAAAASNPSRMWPPIEPFFGRSSITDERPKIPGGFGAEQNKAPYALNFGEPNPNWVVLNAAGGNKNAISKSKMDQDLERIADDLIESLNKFNDFDLVKASTLTPKPSKQQISTTSKTGNSNDNIILFASNEPSIGKDKKSQSLSLDEPAVSSIQVKSSASPTSIDEDNDVGRLFQMFFGPPPSPDKFKFNSKQLNSEQQTKNNNKDDKNSQEKKISFISDDLKPLFEMKTINFDESPSNSPLKSTTKKPESSSKMSPSTTMGPQLDVFVDAVLDEIMPTAAQTSGDKTGAKVDDKTSKENYTCQCEKGPASGPSGSSASSTSAARPAAGGGGAASGSPSGSSSGAGSGNSASKPPSGGAAAPGKPSGSASSAGSSNGSSAAKPASGGAPAASSGNAASAAKPPSVAPSGASSSGGNSNSAAAKPPTGGSGGGAGAATGGSSTVKPSSTGGGSSGGAKPAGFANPIGYAALPAGSGGPSGFGHSGSMSPGQSGFRTAYQTAGSTLPPAKVAPLNDTLRLLFFKGNGTKPCNFTGIPQSGPKPTMNLISLP